MIVAPNSPSERAQLIDQAGREGRSRERDRDVPEQLSLRGAVHARGILEVAIDAGDAPSAPSG